MTETTTTTTTMAKSVMPPHRAVVAHSSGSKHPRQHYYRRVLPRRVNILACETTMAVLCQQVNPTDVRPRCVRFANHEPAVAVSSHAAADSDDDGHKAEEDQCWTKKESDESNSCSASNNDPSSGDGWYSQKDYGRILFENQCIIDIARTLVDRHGSVDAVSLPFVRGLECYISPAQAELRRRKVADHARRVLDSLQQQQKNMATTRSDDDALRSVSASMPLSLSG
jgi:hypothetical protein